MLGSLERIGGTPSILWGMGVVRKGKIASATLKAMTGELTRRAAISFPDEDVLVAARLAQPSCYVLLQSYANVVPRPGYTPNGEDRAWGRRLAKRYGNDGALRRPRVQGRGQGPQAAVPRRARHEPGEGHGRGEDRIARRHARRGPGPGDDRLRLGRRRGARRRLLPRRLLTPAGEHRVELRRRQRRARLGDRLPARVVLAHVRGRARRRVLRGRRAAATRRVGDAGERHRRRDAAVP